jgi:hypothetical protein
VRLEAIHLDEAAGVEQMLDAFAGGELALGVLLLDAARAAAFEGRRVATIQLGEILLESHALVPAAGNGVP